MARLKRHRVVWSGSGVVGGGLTTFYVKPDSTVGEADDIAAFFDALKSAITTAVTITVPSSGDILEDTTGVLVGTWSDPGTGGVITGTSAENFVMGAGARVRWNTSGIHAGRRVKGTTFIAPIQISSYSGTSALSAPFQAAFQTAADALVAAVPELAIWSRPKPGLSGESNLVESATVPDAVSWLRSRRT